MGVAHLLKEELKTRALSMVPIASHFQPVLEEYFEGENGEGEAIFAWTSEEQDEGISIHLDLGGHLTGLSIHKNTEDHVGIALHVEERRKRAEQFLLGHYPDVLEDFTLYKTEKLSRVVRFHFGQIVMDLHLDNSGCFIDIGPDGSVVNFTYYGVKQTPEIPTTLISKEKLIDHVQSNLDFKLTISKLFTDFHNVAEDGLRLVYEPEPGFMNYKAGVLQPTLTIEHEIDDPQTYVPLTPPSNTNVRKDVSNEEIIGITEGMEVIREVEMEDAVGIVWRDRDWERKDKDLSAENYFLRQSEDTVKAFISKETGKVRSFMWFKERSGDLQLDREACYQKAVDFLQMIIPDYYEYLRLVDREIEDEDDKTITEPFSFYLYKGHDIPIQIELVMVVVNRTTGAIDHYSGPRFEVEQLSQVPTEPTISKKEASEQFIKHLDFELTWNKDYESETESYVLTYKACERLSRNPIQYIDATTGKVICSKL
jgi:hypothetical protein